MEQTSNLNQTYLTVYFEQDDHEQVLEQNFLTELTSNHPNIAAKISLC